jgi:hypothetical protein
MQPHHQDAQQAELEQPQQALGLHKPREEAAFRFGFFPSHLPANVKHLHKKHAQPCFTQTSTATPLHNTGNKTRRNQHNIHHTCIPQQQSCSLTIRMRSKQSKNNLNRRLVCTSQLKGQPSDIVFVLCTFL